MVTNMLPYFRAEAKDWARETFRGACNVIIPSYTSDLRSLNEAAIHHHVCRKAGVAPADEPFESFVEGLNPA